MTSFIGIDDDQWSDASSSTEGDSAPTALQPRAYQIEMFEQSLKQNTIVTVSGPFAALCFATLNVATDGNWQRENHDVRLSRRLLVRWELH